MKNQQGLTEQEFLAQYQPGNYPKPSLSVDILIFTIRDDGKDAKLEILLIKRANHPFMGCWALPGGFVNIAESLDTAALRELQEETGITDLYLEQLYTFGDVNRDPRMRVISASYMALVSKDKLNPQAGDDAAEVAWFQVDLDEQMEMLILSNQQKNITITYQIDRLVSRNGNISVKEYYAKAIDSSTDQLAFDHAQIILLALERMRNKVEYTQIAFNLVAEKFTLPELQKVYEAILGRTLLKAAFRRKILPLIEQTGDEKVVDGVIRNAKYYTLRM